MSSQDVLLKCSDLTKEYAPGKGAIGIDLEIKAGEIVGFIGPNGAGKSTTMEMITHLTRPDKGEVEIFGKKIDNEHDFLSIVPSLGFLPSEGGLYDGVSAKELFSYAGRLFKDVSLEKAYTYAKKLRLDLDKKVKNLSLGNKKKVGTILSVLHNPKLLILDEPTSGLDPLIQQEVMKILAEVKEVGGAVFLSSHVLSEVQEICDRVIIIKDAKIAFEGDTKEILKKALKIVKVGNISKSQREAINSLKSVKRDREVGNEVDFYVDDIREIVTYFVEIKFFDFYIEKPTLEDMFIEYYESSA